MMRTVTVWGISTHDTTCYKSKYHFMPLFRVLNADNEMSPERSTMQYIPQSYVFIRLYFCLIAVEMFN